MGVRKQKKRRGKRREGKKKKSKLASLHEKTQRKGKISGHLALKAE